MNLNQITVPAFNMKESIEFYQTLGLKLIVNSNMNHYARFECPNGNATFSLHKVDLLPTEEGVWIYFEVENLDDKVDKLKNAGFVFDEEPADKPWLWCEAKLKDPSGNQLILYWAGNNRKNPPWRIKD